MGSQELCPHIVQEKSLAKVNLAKGLFHFMILIIYTISLGVNKETKKSVKVGAVKVFDTNLIHSSDRPVDIADLLAHELARVLSPLFTDSGELRTASSQICVENQHSTTVVSQESSGECRCNTLMEVPTCGSHHGQHLAQYNTTLRSSNIT